MVEHVVAGGAIIAKGTNQGGEFVVVSGDGTSVAKGTKIFRGIELVAGSGA